MNISDFKPINYTLQEVFRLQKIIKFKFEPSCKRLFESFDIDHLESQEIFKKFAWRITEELIEAKEEVVHLDHIHEEIIDSFNFIIEIYLLYGWDQTKLSPFSWPIRVINPLEDPIINYDKELFDVIYRLGLTCNLLKNRQWRSSQYLVDLYIFEERFRSVWDAILNLFSALGLTPKQVLRLWSLKYQVNNFRIRTNY